MTEISNREPDAEEIARRLPGQIARIRAQIDAARETLLEIEGELHEDSAEVRFPEAAQSELSR
jgi:hypothetical protein